MERQDQGGAGRGRGRGRGGFQNNNKRMRGKFTPKPLPPRRVFEKFDGRVRGSIVCLF